MIEAFAEDSEPESSGAEHDFRELRAKKQALTRKVEEQKRRQQKIQVTMIASASNGAERVTSYRH